MQIAIGQMSSATTGKPRMVRVEHISKRFGGVNALRNVSVGIAKGGIWQETRWTAAVRRSHACVTETKRVMTPVRRWATFVALRPVRSRQWDERLTPCERAWQTTRWAMAASRSLSAPRACRGRRSARAATNSALQLRCCR